MNISRRDAITRVFAVIAASTLPTQVFGAAASEKHYDPTTTGPGRKFSADGHVQPFPGNTILCHLNQPGPRLEVLKESVEMLRAKAGDEFITWLPPSSYHMTVFDGSNNSRRTPEEWPTGLDLHADMPTCNRVIAERLRNFDLGFDPPIRMVADEDSPAPTMTCIPLRPIDESENKRLRDLRNRLSAALGIKRENHDDYGFHMTYGYYYRRFPLETESKYRNDRRQIIQRVKRLLPVIELQAPEFCLFEDMASFQTQFSLARAKSI